MRWEYQGHNSDAAIRSMCFSGEDSLGRMRVVSTDGHSIHSWLECSEDDTVKATAEDQSVAAMTIVWPLDVLAAATVSLWSSSDMASFDGIGLLLYRFPCYKRMWAFVLCMHDEAKRFFTPTRCRTWPKVLPNTTLTS